MPGCWALTAAILMQMFPGSVKLKCPENQSLIRRRLEYRKHEDLPATGYIYNLYCYICVLVDRRVGIHTKVRETNRALMFGGTIIDSVIN